MSSVELRLNGDDTTWESGIIEVNSDYEIVYILKFPNYGDKNKTTIFYRRSNMVSNFFAKK
jgi:hypothetical protein